MDYVSAVAIESSPKSAMKLLCMLLALLTGRASTPSPAPPSLDPLVDYRYTGTVARNANGKTLRSQQVIAAFKIR